jgi:hypothetical protein
LPRLYAIRCAGRVVAIPQVGGLVTPTNTGAAWPRFRFTRTSAEFSALPTSTTRRRKEPAVSRRHFSEWPFCSTTHAFSGAGSVRPRRPMRTLSGLSTAEG